MKRFLTCALCFVSLPAVAVTLWYEKDGGGCVGLYRAPQTVGCGTPVSRLTVTPAEDTTFTGFYVNGRMIVDANGFVTPEALDILRNANLGADSKIPQSYNCASGFAKNGNGVCVDFSGNIEYVEGDSGEPTPPEKIKDAYGCWWVYDFDFVFHDRPPVNPPHQVGSFASGLAPSSNNDITVSHKRGDGFYRNGTKISSIEVPQSAYYTFRGYYGETFNYIDYQTHSGWPIPITDVITDHTTAEGTVWGARFAVPVGAKVMNLGTPNLKTSYCDLEHPNTPPTNVTVHVYGGWARSCDGRYGDCGMYIYTSSSGAYTAGDVKYNHTCDSGYKLSANDNSNSYYVQCEPVGYTSINYSFDKYIVYSGTGSTSYYNCTDTPSGGICQLNGTISLPTLTSLNCGGNNYRFARWLTNSGGLYNGGASVPCTPEVLGGENANITGVLCNCNSSFAPYSQLNLICSNICSN